ncbi:MAG TPA: 3-hydroxybutyrate dehydrogenase [Ferrovibrio sp.]|jgi:3-hydroxybutyrate dehydrogenase|uniref:3-hydroxybutyrate dehydrogenase n=1 Tax=Ferrovibrio sp. TaxID=1917215 RepID=UPI002B4B447D|nr:3-hydroxybutyrate dehydrogenase [Ferrovibrio sp.]HLT76828.1 3-hydroxybutyrate dehydrogenase [Ferrovibrio sp.]
MLKGKSAIVTGSTSGIGLGIARALAGQGVNVMLSGFGDAAEIEKTRAALAADFGVRAVYDNADMADGAAVAAHVKKAEDAFGGVDILVNNAGIQFVSAVDEFPEAKWSAIQNIILNSTFHATKAVLPGMKARNWGRVVNIVSAHGLVASPFKSAYVSAKHGQIGFTKSVALEVAENNITVNAICPGYVRTPLVEGQIEDQAKVHNMPRDKVIREVILAAQPNKRFIEIEEVAALALYLCGDMAKSITGTAIAIDGGWTAR